MMRLTLVPRSMEGIEEKTPQIMRSKIEPQIPPKSMKKKNITAQGRR
jgi:hypothetical protein